MQSQEKKQNHVRCRGEKHSKMQAKPRKTADHKHNGEGQRSNTITPYERFSSFPHNPLPMIQ